MFFNGASVTTVIHCRVLQHDSFSPLYSLHGAFSHTHSLPIAFCPSLAECITSMPHRPINAPEK